MNASEEVLRPKLSQFVLLLSSSVNTSSTFMPFWMQFVLLHIFTGYQRSTLRSACTSPDPLLSWKKYFEPVSSVFCTSPMEDTVLQVVQMLIRNDEVLLWKQKWYKRSTSTPSRTNFLVPVLWFSPLNNQSWPSLISQVKPGGVRLYFLSFRRMIFLT